MNILDLSLREKKLALKKVELLRIMLDKTAAKTLNDISVKEICDSAMISEGTFFNYFPKKTDLLDYFIKLWSIQAHYLAEKQYGDLSGLKKIEFFTHCTTNNLTIGNSRIMYEIIAFQALGDFNEKIDLTTVSKTELMFAFPDNPEILNLEIRNFSDIILNYLQLAVDIGELPRETDLMKTMIMLGSIFYGVPLILKDKQMLIPNAYSMALESLWEGIKAIHR